MSKAARNSLLSLCAFRAGALDASGGNPFPSRLVICPAGTSDARARGKVIVNAETFSGLEDRQNAMKLGMRLVLDAEHCTVPGTPAFLADKEPRAVLAWATLSGSPEEGLVYDKIEPTPLGLEAWKNNQFQDVSPTVFRRADGTVLAVHSAALCRHGEIDGLTIDAASAPARLAPFFTALSATLEPTPPANMDAILATLKSILAALGIDLAADADEAAVTSAAAKAPDKIKQLMQAPPAAMTADMKALQAQLTTLSADITTLKGERDELKRNELIRQAQAEGKIIPLSADTLKITPLAVLEDIVKQAKAGEVPLGRKTPDREISKDKPDAFTASDREVFDAFGLTEDDFKKFGQPASN
jgi:phage I-like protein